LGCFVWSLALLTIRMAATLPSRGRTLQLAETRFLEAAGFAVKNTFIDDASPASAEEQPCLQRRAITAPLPKCQTIIGEDQDDVSTQSGEHGCAEGGDADVMCMPVAREDFLGAASPGSVCESWADIQDLESVASDVVPQEEEAWLTSLIRQECAFLRIVDMFLVPLESAQADKLPVKGVSKCLRVCINGLPAKKRMKWQNPLAWSVALMLQRAGCPAFVKRSQLFAPLEAEGELVRVDLCAPRWADAHEFPQL